MMLRPIYFELPVENYGAEQVINMAIKPYNHLIWKILGEVKREKVEIKKLNPLLARILEKTYDMGIKIEGISRYLLAKAVIKIAKMRLREDYAMTHENIFLTTNGRIALEIDHEWVDKDEDGDVREEYRIRAIDFITLNEFSFTSKYMPDFLMAY